jgi:nucleotide-binding universal stress UspA family protein
MSGKLFKKILITTDASENNIPTIERGLSIARTCGSKVYATYVMDVNSFNSVSADIVAGNIYQMLRDEADAAVKRIKSMAGETDVETVILEGNPAIEIVKFAASHGVDLIVIGTRGKHGLERLLLGSVADSVIRTAGCNVLVVK